MNKTQLVDAIAHEAGLTKADAASALNALLKVTQEALAKGDTVQLVGFGTFKISVRKARVGQNPKTHEKINIPQSNSVAFKVGAELKKAIN